MINITRLPKPYPEECIDQWPSALIGRLTQNATYSQQACLKICLQKTIQKRCKCQSAMLPQLELNSTLKICDTRRRVTRSCVEEVMFRYGLAKSSSNILSCTYSKDQAGKNHRSTRNTRNRVCLVLFNCYATVGGSIIKSQIRGKIKMF